MQFMNANAPRKKRINVAKQILCDVKFRVLILMVHDYGEEFSDARFARVKDDYFPAFFRSWQHGSITGW